MTTRFSLAILEEYREALNTSLPVTLDRVNEITAGRVAPAVDDLAIGAARKVRAAVLFFDLRGFTSFTSSAQDEALKRSLLMLNCVIPMMMRVLFRHGAYVEKNTGDGLMAILGVDTADTETASNALSASTEMMYVLHHVVNPVLNANGIQSMDARIGVDLGSILLARIGMPKGRADHDRSTLTAVGPSANIACRLQGMADTNEIWCGDLVRANAGDALQTLFVRKTPDDWDWIYNGQPDRTYDCWRYNGRATPSALSLENLARPMGMMRRSLDR